MREWNLKSGDPLDLTIAADARLSPVDYPNDHIWELSLSGGEPSALALRTTYGLRARQMRVFPRFSLEESALTDPARFIEPPRVKSFYPNYLQVACAPFSGILTQCEYWIPESHLVAGRIRVSNQNVIPRKLKMEIAIVLQPLDTGAAMSSFQKEVVTVLQGQTADLAPVFFLTGGPQAGNGPFPSLMLELDLAPGNSRQFTWALASLADAEASFEAARRATARQWEGEIARLEMVNANQTVDVLCGDPDWDAALAFAQKAAFNHLIGSGSGLPGLSIVSTRQPDQGFSPRGDGSDYDHLWNGQAALEADYLASLLLPGASGIIQGLVQNFLATQAGDGSVDWKPGVAGQRGNMHAQPVLVDLVWRIYQAGEDLAFLRQTFDPLLRYVDAWFQPRQDRDEDGIPEWEHAFQSGFDENPAFDRWHAWGVGVDIRSAESPSLSAFLIHECQLLEQIARLVGREDTIPGLQRRAARLRAALDGTWDAARGLYRYRDRDTHLSHKGRHVYQGHGPGTHAIPASFEHPARLVIRLETQGERSMRVELTVKGKRGRLNQEESFTLKDIFWLNGRAWLTTQKAYSGLKAVQVNGLGEKDRLVVSLVDYSHTDVTALMPLWAGAVTSRQAAMLVKKSILNSDRYAGTFGLPFCPMPAKPLLDDVCSGVSMIWNQWIAEGLLAYGYRQEAANLVNRLMAAVVDSLKKNAAFYKTYHASSGKPIGERGALSGIAPLGLFLEVLGIRILSPWKVVVSGANPFPWDVTVQYRGLNILRQADKTMVTFPDGQQVVATGTGTQIISLE